MAIPAQPPAWTGKHRHKPLAIPGHAGSQIPSSLCHARLFLRDLKTHLQMLMWRLRRNPLDLLYFPLKHHKDSFISPCSREWNRGWKLAALGCKGKPWGQQAREPWSTAAEQACGRLRRTPRPFQYLSGDSNSRIPILAYFWGGGSL